jgi:1-deoxy-D-xylulose-5-phosphate reductoisomerase
MVKRVAILGSTGSIGRQTLDIIRQHPDRLAVAGLAAGRNATALAEQHLEWPGSRLALFDDPSESGIPSGMQALVDLATADDVDIVVISVAGVIGLQPTLAAITAGKQIALASKEVLVAAGELVMPLTRQHGVLMTPIDSEHSAVFQSIQGADPTSIDRVILTASGGPFRGKKRAELHDITVNQALAHPTWNMGGKITIDSATLMNKALEMIEARWLFDVPIEKVDIVVHPQSIVHSMVQFRDGSVIGQMGWPDMRLPIQYALLYPERKANELKPWSPAATPTLTFEAVDEETFLGPSLARTAVTMGKTMPCAFNAANEEAANAFLKGKIGFLQIQESVAEVMERHQVEDVSLASILEVDQWARRTFWDLSALRG